MVKQTLDKQIKEQSLLKKKLLQEKRDFDQQIIEQDRQDREHEGRRKQEL